MCLELYLPQLYLPLAAVFAEFHYYASIRLWDRTIYFQSDCWPLIWGV